MYNIGYSVCKTILFKFKDDNNVEQISNIIINTGSKDEEPSSSSSYPPFLSKTIVFTNNKHIKMNTDHENHKVYINTYSKMFLKIIGDLYVLYDQKQAQEVDYRHLRYSTVTFQPLCRVYLFIMSTVSTSLL
jgi:hypothetical protein